MRNNRIAILRCLPDELMFAHDDVYNAKFINGIKVILKQCLILNRFQVKSDTKNICYFPSYNSPNSFFYFYFFK